MKTAILAAVILSAATAAADTQIIEFSDHYYVESTGVKDVKPAAVAEKIIPPAAIALPVTVGEKRLPLATARPVTNFDDNLQPVDPAERRASIDNTIQRLQRDLNDLMIPKEGETPEQTALRQQESSGKQRRINKLASELQAIPAQSIELSK